MEQPPTELLPALEPHGGVIPIWDDATCVAGDDDRDEADIQAYIGEAGRTCIDTTNDDDDGDDDDEHDDADDDNVS